jgi:hypothetical protein
LQLTATAFGGVLLFAASGCLSAGANFALVDAPNHLTAASAQTLHLIDQDLGSGFSDAGLAIMLIAFGLAILQSRLLPRWLGCAASPSRSSRSSPRSGSRPSSSAGSGRWPSASRCGGG